MGGVRFLSAGCEARSHCLVGVEGGVVYASHSEVVLARVQKKCSYVASISPRVHVKPVTCVKKVHSNEPDEWIVSGGADGRVVVWAIEGDRLELVIRLDGLTSPVCAVTAWRDGSTLIVVASAEEKLLLWEVDVHNKVSSRMVPLVEEGSAFVLTADIQRLPSGVLLIACGTSKRTIDFYAGRVGESFAFSLGFPAHDDWIHALAFNENEESPLLASASQDTLVKVWRIGRHVTHGEELTVIRNELAIPGEPPGLCVSIESVLAGHDNWVHSVCWTPGGRLLTAGADKTVIVWAPEDGLWMDVVRLGVVGGHAAGFYGAVPVGEHSIVASSYYGGMHAWTRENDDHWSARCMAGGHGGSVTDCVWSPRGAYLVSSSTDKTTRVYAPLRDSDRLVELGRVQVHGHEVECLASLSARTLISGAEEKVFRVFDATKTFAQTLEAISGEDREELHSIGDLVWGACVPALGLSNKAVEGTDVPPEGDEDEHWEEEAFKSNPEIASEPPSEESLQQNTLWPETHKLYGHGFEVYSVCANPRGTLVVTGCKASQPSHASLLVWAAPSFLDAPVTLPGHQLTVTQTAFSPDGRTLLSVSRDRTAILYREDNGDLDGRSWSSFWRSGPRDHSRIIWSCAWFADCRHFVTASRDLKVIMWSIDGDGAKAVTTTKCAQPVTAIDVGGQNSEWIAIGMEDGRVEILRRDEEGLHPHTVIAEGGDGAEHNITRLRFAPRSPSSPPLLAIATANKKLSVVELSSI